MGRKHRNYCSGDIYHISQRGNNKSYIFEDRFDKETFLDIIEEVKEQLPFRLLHYVLMGNHYHLLIEMEEIPISEIMKKINQTYSRFYNAKYSRVGTNYGGRCDVKWVNSARYYCRLIHYFAQNPIKAKLVNDPRKYLWSGHFEIIGEKTRLVSRERTLELINLDVAIALDLYDKLIDGKVESALSKEDAKQLAQNKIQQRLRVLLEENNYNPDLCEDILSKSRKPWVVENRNKFILAAHKKGFEVKEIASFLSLTSNWVGRFLRDN